MAPDGRKRPGAQPGGLPGSRAGLFGFVALVLCAIAAWYGGGVGTPRRETALAETRRAF